MSASDRTIDLVIPNIADFDRRHPGPVLDPGSEREIVDATAAAADEAVYWSTADRVLLLPAGFDRAWFADVHDALGLDKPPVISPAVRSGLLVADLLRDPSALAALREHVHGYATVRLSSWGADPGLHRLAATLRGWGLAVRPDGTPEDAYWTSLYLESTASCLDLAASVPGLGVAPAVTAGSWTELRGAVSAVLATAPQAVVRGRYGVAGRGSIVVRRGRLDNLWRTVARDPWLREFPLVVQEFVAHTGSSGLPTADVLVGDDGVRETVVTGRTADRHQLRSVNVGPGSMPQPESDEIGALARRIGQRAHELGYRGWFGVGFAVGADGVRYLTELHPRRTDAMPAIALRRRWQDDVVAHMNVRFRLSPAGSVTYTEQVRPAFRRLWEDGLRVFPTSVRDLGRPRPALGLVVSAGTVAEAEEIVARLTADISPATSSRRAGWNPDGLPSARLDGYGRRRASRAAGPAADWGSVDPVSAHGQER